MQSHSNTLACQFITLLLTHTATNSRSHTQTKTVSNTQTDTQTHTLFKPSPGISCHTTCLWELSGDRHCQLRVPQMPTSSKAEEKSSLSPSIICANPSWEIVKSMAYLPNSISQRQVLISYLDPFPSRQKHQHKVWLPSYFFTFPHDLTPDNGGGDGGWGFIKHEKKTLRFFSWRKKKVITGKDR